MELTRNAGILTLAAAVLGLATGSHFRGSIIQWRPVDPDNFDGRVSINAVPPLQIGLWLLWAIHQMFI